MKSCDKHRPSGNLTCPTCIELTNDREFAKRLLLPGRNLRVRPFDAFGTIQFELSVVVAGQKFGARKELPAWMIGDDQFVDRLVVAKVLVELHWVLSAAIDKAERLDNAQL